MYWMRLHSQKLSTYREYKGKETWKIFYLYTRYQQTWNDFAKSIIWQVTFVVLTSKYCHCNCIHALEIAAIHWNFCWYTFQNFLQVFLFWIPCLWMIQDILWWIVLLVVLGTRKSHIRLNRGSIVDILTLIFVSWKNIALTKYVWKKKGFTIMQTILLWQKMWCHKAHLFVLDKNICN